MSIEHEIRKSAAVAGGVSLSGSGREVGATEVVVDKSFAASQTDATLAVSFVGNNLQSLFLVADQNVQIEVNSGSSPAKTISLKANLPYEWQSSPGYFTNPFSGITSTTWYITTTAAVRLRGKILTS
jgi:hypothetical protein